MYDSPSPENVRLQIALAAIRATGEQCIYNGDAIAALTEQVSHAVLGEPANTTAAGRQD